jgi:hypothetical protein
MIQYLYTFDYDDKQKPDSEATDIPDHQKTSATTLTEPEDSTSEKQTTSLVKASPTSVAAPLYAPLIVNAQVYALADKYQIKGLKKLSKAKFKAGAKVHWSEGIFLEAIREAYKSTPEHDRGLRDIVAKVACEHIWVLWYRAEFMSVMKELQGFTLDLLERAIFPSGFA